MTKEIASIITEVEIDAIYGFGSFFRSDVFSDIDIVIVCNSKIEKLADTHRKIGGLLGFISSKIGIPIDFTLLTHREFDSRLLREHDALIRLA